MRKHYVTFLSPGTFVSEQTTRPADAWDVPGACEAARGVRERHGATPYGFYFTTCLTADPVPDGEGGWLNVQGREAERSGMFFLGGRLLFVHELRAAGRKEDKILVSNMEANDWPVCVRNDNSWRSVQPFGEKDAIVDPETGRVVRSGGEPELVAYRRREIAAHRALLAAAKGAAE
jgi:hypothetical protein